MSYTSVRVVMFHCSGGPSPRQGTGPARRAAKSLTVTRPRGHRVRDAMTPAFNVLLMAPAPPSLDVVGSRLLLVRKPVIPYAHCASSACQSDCVTVDASEPTKRSKTSEPGDGKPPPMPASASSLDSHASSADRFVAWRSRRKRAIRTAVSLVGVVSGGYGGVREGVGDAHGSVKMVR